MSIGSQIKKCKRIYLSICLLTYLCITVADTQAFDSPVGPLSKEIGDMFGDILGSTLLVGVFTFIFFLALMFLIGLRGVPLLVLSLPVAIVSMWVGGFPGYFTILIGIGAGVLIALGLLRFIGKR
jgi:hypothetical protein